MKVLSQLHATLGKEYLKELSNIASSENPSEQASDRANE